MNDHETFFNLFEKKTFSLKKHNVLVNNSFFSQRASLHESSHTIFN